MILLLNYLSIIGLCSFVCEAPDIFAGQNLTDPMNLKRVLESAAPYSGELTSDFIDNSENVKRVKRVMSISKFNEFFPRANLGKGPFSENGPYYYDNFLKAVAKWPKFCNEVGPYARYSEPDELCKLELASMFAHFAQEVGEHAGGAVEWKQGLYWYEEMGCSDAAYPACAYRGGTCEPNTWQGQTWPCPEGQRYYGRGTKQLSYNYNYGPFSQVIFGDVNVLLENPSKVLDDGWLAFASAVWFYMTPQSPKPSMHDVVTGFWSPNDADIEGNRHAGFGVLIMIINGGIECGGSSEIAQAKNRIQYYKDFCDLGFNISPGDYLGCAGMQQFDAASNGAIKTYWEKSWSGECECVLVNYQTPNSLFDTPPTDLDDPYCSCVDRNFDTSTCSGGGGGGGGGSGTKCDITNCDSCEAISGNPQAATNAQCSNCPQQTWWPCNIDGLCQCTSVATSVSLQSTTIQINASSTIPPTTFLPPSPTTTTTSPSSSTTTTTTTENPSTIATTTPTLSATLQNCNSCENCIAGPNAPSHITDSHCVPCAMGRLTTWPCNLENTCICSSDPVNIVYCDATKCSECVAVENNASGALDEHCRKCPNQTWWPCNIHGLCRCP